MSSGDGALVIFVLPSTRNPDTSTLAKASRGLQLVVAARITAGARDGTVREIKCLRLVRADGLVLLCAFTFTFALAFAFALL